MALAATGAFEIRPDGSATQSGFFNPALGGTDLSQQTLAALTVTDGVTNGSTTVTSATGGFTAPMLGNGIFITGDNQYEIRVVNSANSITVDRNTGTATGQTAKVGGATTIVNAAGAFQPLVSGVLVSGHKQWVRRTNAAGVLTPYNQTPAGTPGLTVSGSTVNPIATEGYNLVRGDGGVAVLNFPGWPFVISGNNNIVRNLQLSTVSGTQPTLNLTGSQCHLENLVLDPGTSNGPAFLLNGGAPNLNVIRRVYAKPNSAAGGGTNNFDLAGFGNFYEYCDIAGSGGQNGCVMNTEAVFRGCIFRDSHLAGLAFNNLTSAGACQFLGCVFWNNGTDGCHLTNSTIGVIGSLFENCIFGMNGGYDLNYAPSDISANPGAIEWAKAQLRCNWFFTTGLGRYHNLPAGADDTALTMNPFNSSTTGVFTLNTLTGGGAAITASPCAVAFADGLNSASNIAGFYGVVPTPGGTTGALATMRSLWRLRTNEPLYSATNSGVPDVTVDAFLDWGMQFLNRISHFHYTTDTTTIALVAGQQEYTAPSDQIEAKWLRYGLRELQRSDPERWRGDDLSWASEPAGEPREWAMYGGLQIILRPTPSAEAVAANPTCTLRYVSTCPSVTTNGPEQLPTQAYRIVVDYAAAAWFMSYPDTALATEKTASLLKEANEAAQLFAQEMSMRSIAR